MPGNLAAARNFRKATALYSNILSHEGHLLSKLFYNIALNCPRQDIYPLTALTKIPQRIMVCLSCLWLSAQRYFKIPCLESLNINIYEFWPYVWTLKISNKPMVTKLFTLLCMAQNSFSDAEINKNTCYVYQNVFLLTTRLIWYR